MKYLYAILGWGIVALGTLHMAATFGIFHTLSSSALWFFSGGITLALTGLLNLLNRSYGHIAPWLRRVCILTNILITIFSVLSGVVTHAGVGSFALVLGLLGGATALSLTQSALLEPTKSNE